MLRPVTVETEPPPFDGRSLFPKVAPVVGMVAGEVT